MVYSFKFLILLTLFNPILNAEILSVMTLNVDNLFDTYDDNKKDDKAFLPLSEKNTNTHIKQCNKIKVTKWRNECLYLDWNKEIKNAKLANIAKNILSYKENGADVIALQEVENIQILNELFLLLKPYGYKNISLLESKDRRGIDTAFISKYEIRNPKLHYIKFSKKNRNSRPIFEVDIVLKNNVIKFYNLHLPSNFYPVDMRIDSLNALNALIQQHNYPSVALGDFNISSKDDNRLNLYKNQESQWYVGHREHCQECKGTYFYNGDKTWSYLDTILVAKNRNLNFINTSINVWRTPFNSNMKSGKPIDFNPITKKGVSDHLAMVAELELN